MGSQGVLLPLILLYIQGSWAQIILTQSPNYITANPGDTVTVSCKSSTDISSNLQWYQQKPGQPPTLIIRWAKDLQSGAPTRFSGSYSGTDFTFKISNIKDEDEAIYYCQQGYSFPLTFGGGTHVEIKRGENVRPTVSIYCPSMEQRNSGSASSVCLIDKFYPGGAQVTWKGDNRVISSGVDTSDKIRDTDNTYSMSSTLTMSNEEFRQYSTMTCEVTHPTLTPALAKSFQTSECTF